MARRRRGRRRACRIPALALALALILMWAGGALASTTTPMSVSGATWYVSTLPAAIVFRVSRPAIALTVIVPPGTLPAIDGTVTAAGRSVPATLLHSQAVPGATALTIGEDTLDLAGAGRASITLTRPGGASLAQQSFTFTVAAGAPAAAPAPTAAESAFITELNAFRAQVGAPPVRVSAALTAAAAAHAAFVRAQTARYATGASVHDEPLAWRDVPGWTGLYARDRDLAFGSATGGGVEVMSSGNPDPVAFLVAETVFHRDLLLDPGALAAGAADVGGQFVLDLSDWGGAAGVAPTLWPPQGAGRVPMTFGGEWPSPLQPFSGLHFPVGTPVTWDDYAAPPGTRLVGGTLTLTAEPGGRPVAGSVLTPQLWRPFSGTGVYMGLSLAFIPTRPLSAHTTYVASVRAQESGPGASRRTIARTWSFTTGDGSVLAPGGVADPVSRSATTTATVPQATAAGAASTPAAGSSSPSPATVPQATASGAASTPATGASSPSSAGAPQAAGKPAAPPATVPKDPWAAIPAAVRTRLAAVALSAKSPVRPFSDLYLAPWAEAAIRGLSAAGVVHGIGANMFGPSQPLTLGQLAVALTAFVPPSPPVRASLANAASVPAWALGPAEEAVGAGWLDAPHGILPVGAWVTRATAVEAITRMLGWSDAAGAYAAAGGTWPAGVHGDAGMSGPPETDLLWAAHVGLIDGIAGQVAGTQALTRAELAEILWRVVRKAGS